MDIIAIIGLAVAVVALAIPFIVEAIRRPRLEIVPSQWSAPVFVPWTLATVRVHNKPITTPLIKKLLLRQSAQGCQVELEYYHWNETAPYLKIPGRWSSVREPLRFVPPDRSGVADPFSSTPLTGVGPPMTAGTAPTTYQFSPAGSGIARIEPQYKVFYDPTLSPGQLDVPVSPDGEQIAVAILRDGVTG